MALISRYETLYEIGGSEVERYWIYRGVKIKTGASPFESQSAAAHVTVAQGKLHIVSDNIRAFTCDLVRATQSLDCESSRLCLIPRSRQTWVVYIV